MATVHNKLTCGLCGFVRPASSASSATGPVIHSPWTQYCRAVYCLGKNAAEPRLSGVGFHRHESSVNYLPPDACQRFDDEDLDLSTMITIQGVSPPCHDPPCLEMTETGQCMYAWGFLFHDSCWNLLEQACAPQPVDISALWRILLSVPYAFDLPNWGHNYGGLYLGVTRDIAHGQHFVLLGRASHIVIPSAFSDPFKNPDLEKLIMKKRINENDGVVERGKDDRTVPLSMAVPSDSDPFAKLPVEIREMILTYTATIDITELRLASRVIAGVPLSQYFFQSRFWPGRELDTVFDGFLLSPSKRAGIDWRSLYSEMRLRQGRGMIGLGEKNRLRIWKQTVRPLSKAMQHISRMSELNGRSSNVSCVTMKEEWRTVLPARRCDEDFMGEVQRQTFQVEVELPPSRMREVSVSFISFFNTRYVTGLRFTPEDGEDVEIGYVSHDREETLVVGAYLEGLHVAVDECAIRGISPATALYMETEYLVWAGDVSILHRHTLKNQGVAVRKIRALFDNFRMQALQIPNTKKPLVATQPVESDIPI
ncbi:hypothetical protein F5Y18DRAFT_72000 [Xylariaceae sp. FL1019]|nr:hypothetical protein F5Y18DRAFT_72000 [Xylariaceae sp. FL1019]